MRYYVKIHGMSVISTLIEGRTNGEAFRRARDFAIYRGFRIVSEDAESITVK